MNKIILSLSIAFLFLNAANAQRIRQYINANNETILQLENVVGKTDWSLGNDENGDFRINSDNGLGDFKFIMDASGNLGLNIYPTKAFHSLGDGLFGNTTASSAKLNVNAAEDQEILRLMSNGEFKGVMDSDGNIGLGPSYFDPAYTLDIRSGKLQVIGDDGYVLPTIVVDNPYPGNLNATALLVTTTANPGYGYAGYFSGGRYGLYAQSVGGDSGITTYGLFAQGTGSGSNYGVYGRAITAGAATNYGLYGYAANGSRNYAMYASGDLKVTSQLFIGTTVTDEDNAAGYELLVDGQAIMEEVKVKNSVNWPDFVFEDDYSLPQLDDVANFIEINGHLPGIPSATQLQEEGGFFIGDMQKRQLQKIEELTLYLIELQKENQQLRQEQQCIRKEMEKLKSLLKTGK